MNTFSQGSSRPFTIVSGGLVLVKTYDGALMVFENGNPGGSSFSMTGKTTAVNRPTENNSDFSPVEVLPKDTDKHVGQFVRVEGVIVSAVDHRPKAIYLSFSEDHEDSLLVRVFEKDLSKFDYDVIDLKGKKVQITGLVTLYWPDGKYPEIIVTNPEQIVID